MPQQIKFARWLSVLLMAIGAISSFLATPSAWAQAFPNKPIRLVCPFPPGGAVDIASRALAQELTKTLGQAVTVDNKPGAGGNIGSADVARSAPDGYTLLMTTSGIQAINPALYAKMPFDPSKDLMPVANLVSLNNVLVLHPSVKANSVAEVIALGKSLPPGAINYASTGVGTATWVAGELFKSMARVDLAHVPYRGGGEAATAVVSGEVSVYFGPLSILLPQAQQGRLRALAVTTPQRLAVAPGLPTIAESGLTGYQSGNWYGIVVPAKTSREVIAVVRQAAARALADTALNKRLTDLGYLVVGDQPDEFGAFMKTEITTLAKIIQQTGARVE